MFGYQSGLAITTSSNNTGFGTGTLKAVNGTGNGFNSAFGYLSCNFLTTGIHNTGLGNGSLYTNTTGNGNTSVGSQSYGGDAGQTTGDNNTLLGYLAGFDYRVGSNNTFIGYQAGRGLQNGESNILIGPISFLNTGSNYNVVIGNINVAIGSRETLSNHIILADGQGNIGLRINDLGLTTLPRNTIANITGDATGKAVVTKEFMQASGITINGSLIPLNGSATITTAPQTVTTLPLASNYVNSTVTRTSVTGWTFNVTAGKRYKIEIIGTYQTAVTTTGGSIGFILSSGAGSIMGLMEGEIVQTTAATGLRTTIRAVNATNTTAGSFMTTTGVGVINSPHYIGGILNLKCTTSGVFEVQFASEVAASSAQLNADSLLLVTEY
ncbi:hypothetical protein [Flavobacterium taihuense]|uniref:Uncharacterized protein n=1 Tax=Flavobacterium taihuense TaxID=2857508 RepID=A0ABS6Y111_9FLAO|nr:hypothetical protein [Flavobacterium taihuense]MBW4362610.1 hypothetical protein [Flavobacterium taihuense]